MRAQEFTYSLLEQALMQALHSKWILVESTDEVQFLKSKLFDDSLAEHQQILPRVEDFIKFKMENPARLWGSNDSAFIAAGPIGRALPKLRHAHLSRDLSIYYTVEGRSPTVIKLYGIFDHKTSGTGTPGNINKQKSFAKVLKNVFEDTRLNELDPNGWGERYRIYIDDHDLGEAFPELEDAIEAIEAYKRDDPKSRYADYNVRDINNEVVWRNDAWQDYRDPNKIQIIPRWLDDQ